MKERLLPASLLGAAAVLFAAVFPFSTIAAAPDLGAVDELFAAWSGPDTPGCALAVVRDGDSLLLRGYGAADLETGRAITPDTVFRLGAASKPFTAAAVEKAAELGQIDLEEDVRQIVPELPGYQSPITVRLLLDQASGLPDYRELFAAAGRSDAPLTGEKVLVALAKERFPAFAPGTKHEESSSNEFILALVVERKTGKSLRDFAVQELFRPLGMSQSDYHDPYRAGGESEARSYVEKDDGGFRAVADEREILGPGGVESSAADLARWMISRADAADGSSHAGSHSGSHAGFEAALVHRENGGVACLCNLAGIDALGLARQVADLVLEPVP